MSVCLATKVLESGRSQAMANRDSRDVVLMNLLHQSLKSRQHGISWQSVWEEGEGPAAQVGFHVPNSSARVMCVIDGDGRAGVR